MKTLQILLKTNSTYGPFIARLALGFVMLPHGAQKVLGWFGGHGFTGTMQFFTGTMHIPMLFALLAITAEFAGALGLIVGLLSRVAAFGIATVMAVAITMHAANGFFMNWAGSQKGEGIEYHILAIGLALVVMIQGAGKASLDGLIAAKCDQGSAPKNPQHASI